MRGREIKETIKSGGRVFGSLIESTCNAKQMNWFIKTGIDFVFIDNEHNPLDRNNTSYACSLFARAGVAPLVRIPRPDIYLATMAVDGGAHGIMVPYVETVEEVYQVVSAVKYRPLKGKGLKEAISSGKFPSDTSRDYIQKLNEDGFVVIMIESAEGNANLDNILNVPGIDAIVIGPNDLSVSLGIPDMYEHPLFTEAVDSIMKKALNAGVGFGIHLNSPTLHKHWMDRGENFILYSSDTYGAYEYIKSGIEGLKKQEF